MKKLGDAISKMDMAGHMGCDENSAAGVSLSPHTPLSFLNNLSLSQGGACPPPIIPPPSTPEEREREIFLGLSFEEILSVADQLGIPHWYADYWVKSMSAKGWKMADGAPIKNWRALLSTWWMRASDRQKAQIEAEYEAAQKRATEEKEDPEPVIVFTARHWHGCQSQCANFREGKCVCGAKRPACFCACNDGFTEKCRAFKPLPVEWQNVWRLDPKFWEPHWVEPNKAYPQGYMFKGWKATEKGQAVKAYFDAHPDELEEARWRDEANAVTEVEKRDSDVYLAWVQRERTRERTAAMMKK